MDMIIIGIAGGTGSGKSTVVKKIARKFGDKVTVLRHDDYYKAHDNMTYEERSKLNYDCPDAFDTELMAQHIKLLKSGQAIDCPVYDYTIHNRSDKIRRVEPNKVLLIDGILIFADKVLRDTFDIKIFVDTEADIRIIRRIERDMKLRERTLDSIVSQYLTTVKPMHDAFVEPSKRYADLIIPEGGHNEIAMSVIENHIKHHLNHV